MAPTKLTRYGANIETPEALMLLNVQPKLSVLLEDYRILTSNNYSKHCLNELTQSHSKQTDTNQVNADAKPTWKNKSMRKYQPTSLSSFLVQEFQVRYEGKRRAPQSTATASFRICVRDFLEVPS
jgi:hypothetical protein